MQPAKSAGLLTILSISPLDDDHATLQSIVDHSAWRLFKAHHLAEAFPILDQHEISVVVCERDLKPGVWIDVLDRLNDLPHPPSLIVTSRLADERLWAEALNLGAWDVLPKPFTREEVLRGVKQAWHHWHWGATPATLKTMRAAS
jgi:DNA-binding response OmpR family regulator